MFVVLCCVGWWSTGCHHVQTTHPQPHEAKPFVYRAKDGKKLEGAYLRGKKHGYFVRWDRHGIKRFEGRYRHGMPQGVHKHWNRYGQLIRRFVYRYSKGGRFRYVASYVTGYRRQELFYEGRRFRRVIWQGKVKRSEELRVSGDLARMKNWFRSGRLQSVRHYHRGTLHGVSKVWHQNGHMASRIHFDKGLRAGPFAKWHTNGKLFSSGRYIIVKLPLARRRKKHQGHPLTQRTRRLSCGDGLWRRWTPKGGLIMKGRYHRCVMIGPWRGWYSNGQLQSLTFYKKGLAEGVAKTWYTNGKLFSQETYVRGYKEGESLQWFDNGQLKLRQYYVKSQLHGLAQSWNRFGKLTLTRRYERGMLHGLTLGLYANGEPHHRAHFWKGKLCGEEIYFRPSGAIQRKRTFPACPR